MQLPPGRCTWFLSDRNLVNDSAGPASRRPLTDRRQDKSHKVRPVDLVISTSNFNRTPNIADIRHNLPFSPMRCHCTAFDTRGGDDGMQR